jgi:hypothetical protein
VAGAFAALYAAAPAVLLRRTKTGWRDAARRAYLLTFGWGDLAVSAVLS